FSCLPGFGIHTRRSGCGRYPLFSDRRITAWNFKRGVAHFSPSTPGVLRPRFSVTRRTARQRPWSEWVSIRCRRLTLRQSPSPVACAIFNCVFRTEVWILAQSRLCQSVTPSKDADFAGVAGCVFIQSSSRSRTLEADCPQGVKSAPRVVFMLESAVFIAPVDQVHVSQGYPLPILFQPVYDPLQVALRFLHRPIPHTPQRPLRVACPCRCRPLAGGRDCHVPRNASIPRLGSVFPPTGVWYRIASSDCDDHLQCRFWPRPIIAVGPFIFTRVQSAVHVR
ncbi:hypothetical protein SAMN04244573_03482, partial [Azotobacter beijerinckii]